MIGHEGLIRGPVDSPLRLPDALLKAAHTEGLSFELELACVQEGLRSWVLRQPDKRLLLNLSAGALVKALERTTIAGINPGSMGARSFIVRGRGNPESFDSCSHGAGRVMSRSEAKRRFTLADHCAATESVECRENKDVIDETPVAYQDIDPVMEAQRDLVDVVPTLKRWCA